eukprot:jgi/Hompol1/6097/HPOL_000357-RA
MSSIRKAAPRRTHRERSQPLARAKLGLLEKHKDYVLRAKDFHKKERAIKALKEKAAFRNPDEFYFGMINAQTNKGVHIAKRNETFDHDFLTLLKTQDQNYINYQRSVNRKKIERLKDSVHFIDEDDGADDEEAAGASSSKNSGGGDDDDELGDDMDIDAPPTRKPKKAPKRPPRHTIFVDDEAQAKAFDPVKHFDTVPELVNRPAMRLRKQDLEKIELPKITKTEAKQIVKSRDNVAKELSSRLERESKLRSVQLELQLQKHLMGKGARKKVGVDSKGLPVYKWKARRQK